jgi:hypothetical protein
MYASAEFRSQNTILFAASIVRDAQVKKDFSAGWGAPLATPTADVIDLNGNGKADALIDDGADRYSDREEHSIVLTEPAIHAPKLSAIQAFASARGAQVVTREDLPLGVFLSDLSARGKEGPGVTTETNVRPIESLVAQHAPIDASVSYAFDLSTNEFLIYKPNA